MIDLRVRFRFRLCFSLAVAARRKKNAFAGGERGESLNQTAHRRLFVRGAPQTRERQRARLERGGGVFRVRRSRRRRSRRSVADDGRVRVRVIGQRLEFSPKRGARHRARGIEATALLLRARARRGRGVREGRERAAGVRREVQSRGDDALCRRTRVSRPVVPRSAGKPVAHGRWRAADRVCDATVGGGTETTGRRTRKRRARESVQARTCRFPIFDDIAPAPRSRETPCLARCGAHAPADVRTMWAAVVPSWSNSV